MSAITNGPACIAPQLTDESLARYEQLAASASAEIKESMATLLKCVKTWWELPESNGPKLPVPHRSTVHQYLDKTIAETLWDYIPYEDELDLIARRFDSIDATSQKELRDAAFHLLWYVRELNLDREPMHKV